MDDALTTADLVEVDESSEIVEILNPLGSIEFPSKNKTEEISPVASYPVQRANKASAIPKVYGTSKVAGNIIWTGTVFPWQTKESASGKGGGAEDVIGLFGNRRSFLIGICEGPATILRIWKGKEQITLDQVTVFRGDGSTDTGINALTGEDFSNYANTCCIFFSMFEIGQQARTPNFTFEVTTDKSTLGKTQIYTPQDLQDMQDNLNGSYEVMNAIDMTGFVWTPVGSTLSPFTGTFDGRYYTISNLSILPGAASDLGMFGTADGVTIENLILTDMVITLTNLLNADHNALLASRVRLDSTIIRNCSVSGTINNSNPFSAMTVSGGLIGELDDSPQILRCSANVVINRTSFNISGWGGLIGTLQSSLSPWPTITDCYAVTTINGAGITITIAGGLFGALRLPATVTNCYSATVFIGTEGANVGGFIGTSQFVGGGSWAFYFSDCFWDNDITVFALEDVGDDGDVANITKKTTSQMYSEATFTNWDYDLVWEINEGGGYPTHRWINIANTIFDENPAVIIKDILTNDRYGAGIDESTWINTASFTAAEEFCDANGLRFSFTLDSQKPMLDWVNYILQHFFGYIFMSQGKISLGVYKEEN